MTPPTASAAPRTRFGVADGIGVLRLLVVLALAVEALSTFVDLVVDAGWSLAGLITTLQLLLTVTSAALVMWLRPRLAFGIATLVLCLALVNRPTGEELWLMLIASIVVAARARVRVLLLVAATQLGYVVLFGVRVERRYPGDGVETALIVVLFCAVGYAAGLLVRYLLRAMERRRQRLAELEQENTEIRATERRRLADDLRTVVMRGLCAIRGQLKDLQNQAGDGTALRRGLDRIDQESRAVLSELRALLEILRRDSLPVATCPATPTSPRRRHFYEVLNPRHVRLAGTAAFGLLAVRATFDWDGVLLDPALAVHALGWIAAAVAVWAPRVGGLVAAGALVVSILAGTPTDWAALPAAVLFFVGALGAGVRRLWLVVLGFLSYGALTAVTATGWADRFLVAGYAGAVGIIGGLATRQFLDVERASTRRRTDLLDDRERVGSQERSAVARDLHDVVAHQLSLTTMMIMGTSATTDPKVLTGTLRKVEECVEAADRELFALLHTMRGTQAAEIRSTRLVLPSTGADIFARRLTASGFRPEIAVDRDADDLDETTQRTLGRIMQEATTNIVRYAPAGSKCSYVLSVTDQRVQLRVASLLPVRDGRSAFSLGWGLRGIAERVELSHGSFTAGPRHGMWLVDVTLPRSADGAPLPAAELVR